jgi:hypothetical protein
VIALAIDQHHAVLLRQVLAKRPRRCDTADATTENQNRLRVSHGPSPLLLEV